METINQELLELVTYSITDAALAKLANDCMGLRVNSPDDEYGYAICKEWRGEVRRKRIEVEDRRKELKKDSLEFGRVVDAEARRITAKIKEVEDHLVKQLDVVDEVKRKEKEEFERALKERTQLRVERAQAIRAAFDYQWLTSCTDLDFTTWYCVEKERFDKEEAEREAQAKLLAQLEVERLAQAAKIAEQQIEQQRLQQMLITQQRAELQKQQEQIRQQEAEQLAQQKKEALALAEKQAAEKKAAKEIANKKLFDQIREQFPTLELAWVEIARLRGLVG